jgi:hypothetical protein
MPAAPGGRARCSGRRCAHGLLRCGAHPMAAQGLSIARDPGRLARLREAPYRVLPLPSSTAEAASAEAGTAMRSTPDTARRRFDYTNDARSPGDHRRDLSTRSFDTPSRSGFAGAVEFGRAGEMPRAPWGPGVRDVRAVLTAPGNAGPSFSGFMGPLCIRSVDWRATTGWRQPDVERPS